MSDSVIIVNSWRRKPSPIPAQHEPCSSVMFFLVFVQQQWGVENFILFFKVLWSKTGFPVVPGEFPGPIEIVFVFLEFLLGSLNERKLERLPKIGISYEMEKPLWGDILGHAYIL